MTLELRLFELHADDHRETLAHVLAGEIFIVLLEDVKAPRIVVHNPRERPSKALLMGSAVGRVNIIRKRQHELIIALVVLHCNLDLGRIVRQSLGECDDVWVDHIEAALLMDVLHEAR